MSKREERKKDSRIFFAKKNTCIWCRAPIKKGSYVWRDGKFFCSHKCSNKEKEWENEKSKLINASNPIISGRNRL